MTPAHSAFPAGRAVNGSPIEVRVKKAKHFCPQFLFMESFSAVRAVLKAAFDPFISFT